MTQPKIGGVGLGKPVMPFGSDGTDWYAFLIDALGHLQVDVVSAVLGSGGATEATLLLIKGYVDTLETLLAGGLPAALDSGGLKVKEQSPLTGFATATNQTTMITALQLIDDLRNALGSVNTDDLQVDVKTSALPTDAATQTTLALVKTALQIIDDFSLPTNKLFSYYDRYVENLDWVMDSTAESKYTTLVPGGEIWILACASIRNLTGAATDFKISVQTSAIAGPVLAYAKDYAPYLPCYWNGSIVLRENDRVAFTVGNSASGESIEARAWGYKMKVA